MNTKPVAILFVYAFIAVVTTHADDHRRPGWIGLGFTDQPGAEGKAGWLHVRHVLPGSPAATAGLKPQDLIVAINGKPPRFKDSVEAMRSLSTLKPGDRVTFIVTRGGLRRTVKVVAAVMPDAYYERWKDNERARRN
jgi:S1-C subfamily serine protease